MEIYIIITELREPREIEGEYERGKENIGEPRKWVECEEGENLGV